ncbi:MAG: hypothetical protein ACRBG0_01720 [Lewinella sp.]|uniref:hypothetical protein n=1 Tax=Lewinella sp. TaxID=2004506 RepID=UPI003D6B35BC
MKPFIYFSLILLLLACEKAEPIHSIQPSVENLEKSDANTSPDVSAINNNYKIHCEGPCDCGLEGNTTDHVSCKCEECVMIIERDGKRFELVDAEIEIPFLKDFYQHISENYKESDDISITEIEIQTSGESKAVRFDYLVNKLVADDVIIVSERGGKTYKVSCDGTCDCRSRFEFDPPAASCSCEDCVLTVESID